ncbi:YgaP-like transmembrane domain [Brevifollis gellanilyticus]|nr:YgaP-like transmembrane domain [Brevifollis gellanilyticus]
MSLTFQPFDHIPKLDEIGKSLHKNVSPPEQTLSALSGLALLGLGCIQSRGSLRLLMLGTGTALLGRAWTGHCPVYEELDIRRRKAALAEQGN